MELEHAGVLETSLMLYLFPDSVQERDMFPGETTCPPGFEIYPEAGPEIVGSGALSPATHATPEIGSELCRLVIEGLADAARAAFPRPE